MGEKGREGISGEMKKKRKKVNLVVRSNEIKKNKTKRCKEKNWDRTWLVMGTCRAGKVEKKQISFL